MAIRDRHRSVGTGPAVRPGLGYSGKYCVKPGMAQGRDHLPPQLESAARVAVVRQMQIVLAYGVQVTTLPGKVSTYF